MQACFLLGPAGCGKTFRCLAEIRAELMRSAEGAPLVLLAPKQATFQLERQLLADRDLAGFTRLRILSFERLARFVFEELGRPLPQLLAEEGRVMVLRALVSQRQHELSLFRASARLPGLAQELSSLLREFQQHDLTPGRLNALARQVGDGSPLARKLHDLGVLSGAYQDWLRGHALQDADSLLNLAADEIQTATRHPQPAIRLAGLWLDGFAQMTPQERRLLALLVPCCGRATLAFCLESEPPAGLPWHSPWALIGRTYRQCRAEISALPAVEVVVERIERDSDKGRFTGQPVLQHLERHWAGPRPGAIQEARLGEAVRVVSCPDPAAEATLAAREILRFVRDEGRRFRDVAVLVRSLASYHEPLRRALTRFGIPFFLDRRESIAHHPLAELTRFSLRTLAFGWRQPDWFAALKTGLVPARDRELDELENEALSRGWEGSAWRQPIRIERREALGERLERLRARLLPPFTDLEERLGATPTGVRLAEALRAFWMALEVEQRLADWSARSSAVGDLRPTGSLHAAAWTQMQEWLDNLALAFPEEASPLRDWLPIVEAGLARLTVGVIPPSLDHVLIGAIDRARNPELARVFVLGLNESAFPAPPAPTGLLTEAERALLEKHGHGLGPDRRVQLGHERFYGYIAFTRARERLVLTLSQRDAEGRALNSSVFVEQVKQLFPGLAIESLASPGAIGATQHASELVVPLLRTQLSCANSLTAAAGVDRVAVRGSQWSRLARLPAFAPALAKAAELAAGSEAERISPEAVSLAYGAELHTSVSALEGFAECPFKFFVQRGLQAGERQEFTVDPREKGSFQHAVLRDFHETLRRRGQRWRDLEPAEACALIRQLGEAQLGVFRDGLFAANDGRRFTARLLIEALEKLIGTLVRWNREQYAFDPRLVEVEFGPGKTLPGWRLDVDAQHALVLRGRIDRLDVCVRDDAGDALAVVIDYKSSEQKIDRTRLHHGLELQLLAYLGVLEHIADPQGVLQVAKLLPAGVFYLNLKGAVKSGKTRAEVLEPDAEARATTYQHLGRFDRQFLKDFDSRDARQGDQFKYKRNDEGEFAAAGNEALEPAEFRGLLDEIEGHLRRIGQEIFAGRVKAEPYRKGQATACEHCDYRPICRFDPWVSPYRSLKPPPKAEKPGAVAKSKAVKRRKAPAES